MKTLFCFLLFFSVNTFAYVNKSYWGGVAYYSENAINETAQKPDASSGLLGAANYPFVFRWDYSIWGQWFIAPQFNYTLFAREVAGKTAKVSIMHLNFLIGKNTSVPGLDWSISPGYFSETIKGEGGTVQMNNGTGTATFAKPGRTSTIKKVSLGLGTSYTSGKFRYGFDFFMLAPFSNKERTQNLMFSITYQIGGGGSRSSASYSSPSSSRAPASITRQERASRTLL